MTKIEIISGFLGAGKTTLIRKFIEEKDPDERLVIVENEFGEVGIDGAVLAQSGVSVREINSGCICCSLVGSFDTALRDILKKYCPDRIIIEPSGVGKLSDVFKACKEIGSSLNAAVSFCATVVDAKKYSLYRRNFAEFYVNQIESAQLVLLSRTDLVASQKQQEVVKDILRINPAAHLITTSWDQISSEDIRNSVNQSFLELAANEPIKMKLSRKDILGLSRLHAARHESSEEIYTKEPKKTGHSASEVFSFWGAETPVCFDEIDLKNILLSLSDPACGTILRAKGIVKLSESAGNIDNKHTQELKWCVFDFVPGEIEIRPAMPSVTGKICIIGSNLNSSVLEEKFGI